MDNIRDDNSKSKVGRPTVRTEANAKVIAEGIEYGMSRRKACGLAGITYTTLKAWCNDDPEFSARLTRAEAHGILFWAKKLRADPDFANPGKFYLATHDADAFTERKHVAVTGHESFAASMAALESELPPIDDEGTE